MAGSMEKAGDDRVFMELRRKVRESELLSAAVEKLLSITGFSGKLCIVVQNGRVLKSGYEEGYFSHRGHMAGENAMLMESGPGLNRP